MKKMGIVTGALLMGLGAFLLWKNDPNVNRPLAIFMTLYGAVRMGMANAAVPHDELEATALQWAKEINAKSPTAQKMLKYAWTNA